MALGRPNRLARLNASHPAAHHAQLVVAAPVFYDLVIHQNGTIHGTPSDQNSAIIGRSLLLSGSGQNVTFSGRDTAAPSLLTMAAIARPDDAATKSRLWVGLSDGANGSFHIGRLSTGFFALTKGTVVDISSGITLSQAVPYFVAASYRASDGHVNFVVRRLDTGAISTASAVNTSVPVAGSGTWGVGGESWASANELLGALGAASISYDFLTIPELLRWAADPWDLWFPPLAASTVVQATAPITSTLFRRTLSPLGTRSGSRQAA